MTHKQLRAQYTQEFKVEAPGATLLTSHDSFTRYLPVHSHGFSHATVPGQLLRAGQAEGHGLRAPGFIGQEAVQLCLQFIQVVGVRHQGSATGHLGHT